MNRSILIVICDFIVSAMLSLATGVSPVENPFGSHGAPLDSHTAAMVMNSLRQEQARLEEARKALLDAQFEKGFAARFFWEAGFGFVEFSLSLSRFRA